MKFTDQFLICRVGKKQTDSFHIHNFIITALDLLVQPCNKSDNAVTSLLQVVNNFF